MRTTRSRGKDLGDQGRECSCRLPLDLASAPAKPFYGDLNGQGEAAGWACAGKATSKSLRRSIAAVSPAPAVSLLHRSQRGAAWLIT